jgi:hypothetical protein
MLRASGAAILSGDLVIRIILRSFAVPVALAVTANIGAAQSPAPSDSMARPFDGPRASTTVIIGPADFDAGRLPNGRYDFAPVPPRRAFSRAETLMIVGGAALVAGLVVGDDAGTVLVLAGVGIGGYGLYLYLQSPDTRLLR